MRDGPLKITVKLFARLCYQADLKFTRWIKTFSGEPYFRLTGACNQCGQCCRTPAITVHPVVLYLPLIKRAVIAWHRIINGFELIDAERQTGLLVFRCTHWDDTSGQCDSYASRPGICRDYPTNLVYTPDPELFDTCGFRVVLKNAEKMSRALDEAGLSAETLAYLKTNLHVEPTPDSTDEIKPSNKK